MPSIVNRELVLNLKSRLAQGEFASDLAKEFGLQYMVVYRIAAGLTWADVPPFGAVSRVRQAPGRQRSIPIDVLFKAWEMRRLRNRDWKRIAFKLKVNQTTLRRTMLDFSTCLAYRFRDVLLTAGSYDSVCKKYGVSAVKAAEMDASTCGADLPTRLIPLMNSMKEYERKLVDV